MKNVGHFINGKQVEGESGRFGPIFNPATGEETGRVAMGGEADVDAAVRAATAAFADWSPAPVLRRMRVMFRLKELVERNTRQFVEGYPANNVLLTGARGTGKSSLIKALLNKYSPRGLRLIEVDKRDLVDLPDIVDRIGERPERFVLYCDDLSFDAGEPGFKALKVVLSGSTKAGSFCSLVRDRLPLKP